jgi:deoxyribodipyrimidine photo-lyase
LSAHLAYGNLSLREVVQATCAQMARLSASNRYAAQGLAAFVSRLHWHCHFIQKLESEPELEWRNIHRGYDSLREPDWNPSHFEALKQGRTGWPMVDACVAMLRETGWLNFRMRAMLVSVAAYPLWLHWREVGLWLAREFLDYEPGIHWSQLQMQSGTTGINTTRVYNPIKQAQDHDPLGLFVRRWLPALRRVPDAWLRCSSNPEPRERLIHENAQKIRATQQNLPCLRPGLYMAQKVGARLGAGQVLLRTLPPRITKTCGWCMSSAVRNGSRSEPQ